MADPILVSTLPLYEHRFLVLVEISPQSNKYRQMLLTGPEFDKITAAYSQIFPAVQLPNGQVTVEVRLSNKYWDLSKQIPEIKSFHTDTEIGRLKFDPTKPY
jgi:hypothetical protein